MLYDLGEGMSIKIHFYLFMFIAYLFLIGKLEIFLIFYISVLIHEIAHVIVALILKVNVTELILLPFGVCATYSENISPRKEIIISFAGPIMSLIMAIFSKDNLISNVNFIIMILNLIPIYPLDGGRLQKNFLILKYKYKKGIKISQNVSDLFLVILFVFSIIFIVYLKNFYLLFLAFYIYSLSRKEMKKERILSLINYLQTE